MSLLTSAATLFKTRSESNNGRLAREQGGSGLACRGSALVGLCRRQTRFHGADAGLSFVPCVRTLGGRQGLSGPGQSVFSIAGLEKQDGAVHGDVRGVRRRQLLRPIECRAGQRNIALLNEGGGGNLERQ